MKKTILLLILSLTLFSCKNHKKNQIQQVHFKGFMIDAPRTIAKISYYYHLINFCSEWGFNTIIFRLTDDSGTAYQFETHPELKTIKDALNKKEIQSIIKYARERNIEIIPEIESFGHTRYITDSDKYKHLTDNYDTTHSFNAVCPVCEETHQLLKELYAEIAELFPSEYLHIGLDESNWGGHEETKKALLTKSKNEVFAEYVNKLHSYVKDLGKKTIIWGDAPIYEEKELLDLINKEVIIMDWNYWHSDEDTIRSSAQMVLDKGYKLIGAPAINWWMWGPRVGKFQLDNLKSFQNVYKNLNHPNNMGIIVTHWKPDRYIQGCQWDTYALAGSILNNEFNTNTILKKFVEAHYGASWNDTWKNVFYNLYKYAPKNGHCWDERPNTDIYTIWPWMTDKDIINILEKNKKIDNHFPEIINMLDKLEEQVSKNKDDFDDLQLTVEIIDHMIYRQNLLFSMKDSLTDNKDAVYKLINKVAKKDSVIVRKMEIAWKKGRRGEMSKGHMWHFYQAAHFSDSLSTNPDILIEIIKYW